MHRFVMYIIIMFIALPSDSCYTNVLLYFVYQHYVNTVYECETCNKERKQERAVTFSTTPSPRPVYLYIIKEKQRALSSRFPQGNSSHMKKRHHFRTQTQCLEHLDSEIRSMTNQFNRRYTYMVFRVRVGKAMRDITANMMYDVIMSW